MNPAFIFLVILGVIILWFLLSFLYKPLGKLISRIYKDAIDEINNDTNNKEETESDE